MPGGGGSGGGGIWEIDFLLAYTAAAEYISGVPLLAGRYRRKQIEWCAEALAPHPVAGGRFDLDQSPGRGE